MTNAANLDIVRSIVEDIWNRWRADLVPHLIAVRYTVHRDPHDPWDGKTIDHAAFVERLTFTRHAFPDHHFAIEQTVAEASRVAVQWTYTGTHTGEIPGFPATGRRFSVPGMTIYAVSDGRATGHWQALDRLDLMRQLGFSAPQ